MSHPPPLPNVPPQRHDRTGVNEPRYDDYGSPYPRLLTTPRKNPAGQGLLWLTQAWLLCKQNLPLWIGINLAMFVLMMIASSLPVVGFFSSFFIVLFIAGMMKGCDEQAQGGELKFEHLFAGFRSHLEPLAITALIYMAGAFITMLPMVIVMVGLLIGFLGADVDSASIEDLFMGISMLGILLGVLVTLALTIPLTMAIWFAPALVILHDVPPFEAMKMSFKGCMANIMPYLLYGLLCLFVLGLLTLITFGLALLVIMPLLFISTYVAYRDVWTDQPLESEV